MYKKKVLYAVLLVSLLALAGIGSFVMVKTMKSPQGDSFSMLGYPDSMQHETMGAKSAEELREGEMYDDYPFTGQTEEVKKTKEMEEMNALQCPGMLLSELESPADKAHKYRGAKKSGTAGASARAEGMVDGISGEFAGSSVSGYVQDNRQFPQFPQDQLDASELLPKEQSKMFAQLFPEGQGHLSNRRDFLTSGFHIGINTVGQSLRNANKQLRSDPPNPQVVVSPWMNTTITPDINRRQLEIGN
jgi:hypothetical protein